METHSAGPNWIRMEEESEEGNPAFRRAIGFTTAIDDAPPKPDGNASQLHIVHDLVVALATERQHIVENEKLTARDKRLLLEENRKALTVATGGNVTKTDSVVYGILIFGGSVMIVLALLTAFFGLAKEVTLAFVGTVLGGVIATIAQKLGKI